jgi:nitrilase
VVAAAVQATPVFLDRDASAAKALSLIKEAGTGGAGLIVFPEAFLPSYPEWVWRVPPWSGPSTALYGRLLEQAVEVPSATTTALGRAARLAKAYVALGVNERDPAGSTIYNTLLYFGPDGSLLGAHRKLMPTGAERLVWGYGDGSTLEVFETPFGRLGGLLCWENYMPLARYALYAQKLEVLVAPTWDCGDEWIASMRHIAREGGCWVIGTGTAIQASDIPADFPDRARIFPDPDDWLCDGDAVVVHPSGRIAAGPLRREKGILFAEIDAEFARRSRRSLDVTGHYARPDIFRLTVNRAPMKPVEFEG